MLTIRLNCISSSPRLETNFKCEMGCEINTFSPLILCKFSVKEPNFPLKTIAYCSYNNPNKKESISTDVYSVHFKTLGGCKLGISRYPDFEYNAEGGKGIGSGARNRNSEEIAVSFDLDTLYIPPLTTETTKFLGLPMPPFLKIDIVPEIFQGVINRDSGKVDLEFVAKFCFSVGSIYRAPPLLVRTVLTSEESNGKTRGGRGRRLENEGKCRLVGVATVDPINDAFMDIFLQLPTECLALLDAAISISDSSKEQ